MATCTIVITYTPAVADTKEAVVTSYTVDGTAFGSLTGAQVAKAITLGRKLGADSIRLAKTDGKGRGGRDLTS